MKTEFKFWVMIEPSGYPRVSTMSVSKGDCLLFAGETEEAWNSRGYQFKKCTLIVPPKKARKP